MPFVEKEIMKEKKLYENLNQVEKIFLSKIQLTLSQISWQIMMAVYQEQKLIKLCAKAGADA